jgi:hypothetical protein
LVALGLADDLGVEVESRWVLSYALLGFIKHYLTRLGVYFEKTLKFENRML